LFAFLTPRPVNAPLHQRFRSVKVKFAIFGQAWIYSSRELLFIRGSGAARKFRRDKVRVLS
jgi:hypothetical protein